LDLDYFEGGFAFFIEDSVRLIALG